MSLSKIYPSASIKPVATNGPTSSQDISNFIKEVVKDLTNLQTTWNDVLVPLLDTLPKGNTIVPNSDRVSHPNPFLNGLDGSQVYTNNNVKPSDTNADVLYSTSLRRPQTIEETILSLRSQLQSSITTIEKIVQDINASNSSVSEITIDLTEVTNSISVINTQIEEIIESIVAANVLCFSGFGLVFTGPTDDIAVTLFSMGSNVVWIYEENYIIEEIDENQSRFIFTLPDDQIITKLPEIETAYQAAQSPYFTPVLISTIEDIVNGWTLFDEIKLTWSVNPTYTGLVSPTLDWEWTVYETDGVGYLSLIVPAEHVVALGHIISWYSLFYPTLYTTDLFHEFTIASVNKWSFYTETNTVPLCLLQHRHYEQWSDWDFIHASLFRKPFDDASIAFPPSLLKIEEEGQALTFYSLLTFEEIEVD